MAYQSGTFLAQMSAFVAVADCGGFTAAARRFDVRKATLSQRVKALEQRMNTLLLVRTTRALRLTEHGQRFLEPARESLLLAASAAEILTERDASLRGTLTISVAPPVAKPIFERALLPLMHDHPGLAVHLDTSARVVDLGHENFDLAVRVGPLTDTELGFRAIGTLRGGWYASPGYVQQFGTPAEPSALDQHHLVDLARDTHRTQWPFFVDGEIRWQAIVPRIVVPDFAQAVQAVLGGYGILRASIFTVSEYLADGRLIPVLETFDLPSETIFAVYPMRSVRLRKVDAVLARLEQTFER